MNEKSRQDYLDSLSKASQKTINTTTSSIEGKVDDDGVTYTKTTGSFIGEGNIPEFFTHHSLKACSFGHVLQGQKITILGQCQVCQRFTCSMPGCHFVCAVCARSLCRRHTVQHGEMAYCRGWCNFIYWWRRFCGLD